MPRLTTQDGPSQTGGPHAHRGGRVAWFSAGALYAAFALATGALASLAPLAGDDFEAVRIGHVYPGLPSWTWYWYSHLFGRLPAILAEYAIVRSDALFALLVALTLPAIAFLVAWLGLGRRPSRGLADFALVAFLTVALWFSLPIQWDTFWRSGWPSYSLAALLGMSFLVPYRTWLAGSAESPDRRGPLALVGMLALGIVAGCANESVLGVLVVLGAAFVWRVARDRSLRRLPASMWSGLVGLSVGASLLLLAPGNRVRAAQTGGLTIALRAHVAETVTLAERVFFIWLAPASAWIAALAMLALAVAQRERVADAAGSRSTARAALAAAVVAIVPVAVFPEVADFAGERVIFFSVISLFIAVTALVAPDGHALVLERVPQGVTALVISLLLMVALGDVGVNARYAYEINRGLRQRATAIAERVSAGETSLTVPPLEIGEVGTATPIRALLWGDIGSDPTSWVNRAIASYYGVHSIATPRKP